MKSTTKQIIVTNSYEQQILEEKIDNHFLKLVSIESIEQMIERFRRLFLQSSPYETPEISTVLERILQFPECEEKFNYILNRCCYILINHQQQNQEQKNVLEKLIQLFSQATSKSDYSYYGYCQTKKIL
ncbi:MAG: hypothetical protein F6K22_20655 [Okeania sp. SIO2F4]|uniref:hypothetical protein n=1 Tax=Okeania sp. SIO2F4 TaxID=2607790 RepID=UPI00142B38E9|nr:hypothetical protein [Okeania sp. SIO2F4]NES05027.1 hypothetical protein [Okeania sp. SIO2F4]